MGIHTTPLAHIFLIVTSFNFFVPTLASMLHVVQQGVYPVEKGDVALIFYANLSYSANIGDMPIAVRLEMEKCCLKLVNGADCETMKLIGGPGIVLRPQATHMLQMYFVNPDLLDRDGNCALRVISKPSQLSKGKIRISTEHREWTKELELTITFNTVLPGPSWGRKLWISLGGSSKGVRICEHDDNPNAIHECANQNCLVRFAGIRSLYNSTSNQCDTTPACNEDNMHMSAKTGKCGDTQFHKKIRESFSNDMLHAFSGPLLIVASHEGPLKPHHNSKMPDSKIANQGDAPTTSKVVNKGVNSVTCGHGLSVTLANGMTNCTCQTGWTSQALEEWQETSAPGGGVQNQITAVYQMCTVPIDGTSSLRPGFKGHILMYLAVVVMIIIILYLIYLTRQREKPSSTNTLYYHSMIASSSTDEDGEITDTTHQQTSDEETDAIISEIANRREPSKSRSHHDHPPQPPPSAPDASGGNEHELKSSTVSFNLPPEQTSHHPDRFENLPEEGKDSNPVNAGERHLQFAHPSEPLFSPSRGFNPQFEGNLWHTDANLNRTIAYAKRTPSMDEILNLSQNESLNAHVPLAPALSRTTIQTHYSMNDINMNRNIDINNASVKDDVTTVSRASCVSSEALITQKKKEEWAQFITSISEEKLASPVSNAYTTPPYSDVESDEEKVTMANKVQSLPQMPSPSLNVFPNPPDAMVQKAIREMDPVDYENRQTAYRILSSLSNSRVDPSPQRSQAKSSKHSIWSNVASENTVPPEPGKVSQTPSLVDVRMRQIYGDLGSDNDSDDALKNIAIGSSSKSKQNFTLDKHTFEPSQLTLKPTNAIQTRPTVAEIFENNRKLNEERQNQIQRRSQLLASTGSMQLAQLHTESDKTPSQCYLGSKVESSSCSSTGKAPWRASCSSSDTILTTVGHGNQSWVHGATHGNNQRDDKQSSLVDVQNPFSHSEPQQQENISKETESAYRIKSALQSALKASRSRSGHSFF